MCGPSPCCAPNGWCRPGRATRGMASALRRHGDRERHSMVEPVLVAGITVATPGERGTWRHPIPFTRLRPGVTVTDVPAFGEGAPPAVG